MTKPEFGAWQQQERARSEKTARMLESMTLGTLVRLLQPGPEQAGDEQQRARLGAPSVGGAARNKKPGPSKKERKRRQAQSHKQRRK